MRKTTEKILQGRLDFRGLLKSEHTRSSDNRAREIK